MKKTKTNKLIYIILLIFIFPRSFESVFPMIYEVINALKILSIIILAVIFLKNKIHLSKFSFWALLYFLYVFLITMINDLSLMTFIKTYILNFGILLLCEIIFNDEKKDIYISKISNIFLVMLFINLIFMFVCKTFYGTYYFQNEITYFLGQDNRFILYILPPIICYNYCYSQLKSKKDKNKLILTYIISLIILAVVWSVSALIAVICLILGNLFVLKFKNFRLNIRVIVILIMLLNIGIVFFRIQNIFSFFIVDVLHKTLHLSYRTNIWDIAINIFRTDFISLLFGHGFFDVTNTFTSIVPNAYGSLIILKPNHLHNIIMNCLFFGGIIGSFIYVKMYSKIVSEIRNIKDNKYLQNTFTIIISAMLILLIFDTFEFYQLYYFILYLLFGLSVNVNKKEKQNLEEKQFETFKQEEPSDKVGIMLATYNGGNFLAEQIDSIINQTYKNWILYISDDHSNDNTLNIISEYKKKYKNKIILIKNENKLSSAKLNFANLFTKIDQFDYYMFCDQDDVWDKDKIYKLLYFIKKKENNEQPVLVYCDAFITDKSLNIINKSLIHTTKKEFPQKKQLNHFLVQNYFPGCTVLFNNDLKKYIHDIYDQCEMHDWWLSLVAAYCGNIYFLDESLHYYRQHENNTIGAQKENDFFHKTLTRFKKMLNIKNTSNTWLKYQRIVLTQAQELEKRYCEKGNDSSQKTVEEFIKIMSETNKIKKLYKLLINSYTPSEIIRVFRLL